MVALSRDQNQKRQFDLQYQPNQPSRRTDARTRCTNANATLPLRLTRQARATGMAPPPRRWVAMTGARGGGGARALCRCPLRRAMLEGTPPPLRRRLRHGCCCCRRRRTVGRCHCCCRRRRHCRCSKRTRQGLEPANPSRRRPLPLTFQETVLQGWRQRQRDTQRQPRSPM